MRVCVCVFLQAYVSTFGAPIHQSRADRESLCALKPTSGCDPDCTLPTDRAVAGHVSASSSSFWAVWRFVGRSGKIRERVCEERCIILMGREDGRNPTISNLNSAQETQKIFKLARDAAALSVLGDIAASCLFVAICFFPYALNRVVIATPPSDSCQVSQGCGGP